MIQDMTAAFNEFVIMVARHRIFLLLFACVGLGAAGAWLISGIPFREHLLDTPNARSSHALPTPKGGGVGILAAFILAGLTLRIQTTFIFAAILISAVSFYGDYFRISVKFRLIVQSLSALIFLFPLLPRLSAHYALSSFGFSRIIFLIILLLILLFLIGTANFYNFMDGINGIAGVSGAIAFGMLGAYSFCQHPPVAFSGAFPLLAVSIALACLGYLPFNLLRARVFMGDVGSILLGFVFAALVVVSAMSYLEMFCFAALLFPFYADELTTMAVRLRHHEDLARSHRRHLYQLLANELGIAHWKITLMYGAVQLAVGSGALLLYRQGTWPVVIFLAGCFLAFSLLTLYVRVKCVGAL